MSRLVKRFIFTLPVDLFYRIQERAFSLGISSSALCRLILSQALSVDSSDRQSDRQPDRDVEDDL